MVILCVFWVVGAGFGACSDSDINRSVLCYHHKRGFEKNPPDSVLIGNMTFDPLPEYQKPSKVLIEWYCDREITKNLNLRVEGPVWNYHISRPLPVWAAPIHKGDTVRTELTITPAKVKRKKGLWQRCCTIFMTPTLHLGVMTPIPFGRVLRTSIPQWRLHPMPCPLLSTQIAIWDMGWRETQTGKPELRIFANCWRRTRLMRAD